MFSWLEISLSGTSYPYKLPSVSTEREAELETNSSHPSQPVFLGRMDCPCVFGYWATASCKCTLGIFLLQSHQLMMTKRKIFKPRTSWSQPCFKMLLCGLVGAIEYKQKMSVMTFGGRCILADSDPHLNNNFSDKQK